MNVLQKAALWNCSSVILHLTPCNSLAFVKTWPLPLPDCASVCFWQPFFFFLQMPPCFCSLLAWWTSSGKPSLQFAIVCHHLPLWHRHPCTRTHSYKHTLLSTLWSMSKLATLWLLFCSGFFSFALGAICDITLETQQFKVGLSSCFIMK